MVMAAPQVKLLTLQNSLDLGADANAQAPKWLEGESSKKKLVGGLEHVLFSPIVGMMIQSDFHIFQGDGSTTN
jgi:hypothetical protein